MKKFTFIIGALVLYSQSALAAGECAGHRAAVYRQLVQIYTGLKPNSQNCGDISNNIRLYEKAFAHQVRNMRVCGDAADRRSYQNDMDSFARIIPAERKKYATLCGGGEDRAGLPSVPRENPQPKSAIRAPAALPKAGTGRSASCSDITGTGSKTPAAKQCGTANSALTAARTERGQNPKRSAQQYKKAADAFRSAGDTTRADAILREAAGQVAVVTAPGASGSASGAIPPLVSVPASTTAVSPPRRMWSGQSDDCDSAGQLERNTAAWYNMCVPFDPTELEKSRPNHYRPPISPQDLTARAIDECKQVPWDGKRQCIFDAKLRRLLADDPHVRAECSSKAGREQIVCIDTVYLHGPGSDQSLALLQDNIRERLRKLPDDAPDRQMKPGAAQTALRDNRCPPGQGMKPTPGAFGAWSCQVLRLVWPASDRPRLDAANTTDPVQAFEDGVNHVAAAVVVAATDGAGARLSAADRETCAMESFTAVHSTLKGGAPPVSEQCRPMARTARAELAYYADVHVDTVSSPGVEELLSLLNARSPSSSGLNSGALVPPRDTAAPAADCSQAEAHWKSAEDLKLLAIYEDHLARFPTCNFATIAVARIKQLKKR